MRRFTFIAIGFVLFFSLSVSIMAAPKPPQVEVFNCNNYSLTPPFLADAVAPSTTLIVDSSGSMNEHAYQEIEIGWRYSSDSSNRRAYTGFNSTYEYYGFFDSRSYYAYNSTGNKFYPSASGEWNGNFMNWVSMHRTDVVRKVLTGGPYSNSTSTYTVSNTDESNHRGKYHVFDASSAVTDLNNESKHVVPAGYREKLGFVQVSGDDFLYIYAVTSVDTAQSPDRWNIGAFKNQFTLSIHSEKKYGVLDRFGYRMRLSLFRYDDDGSNNNGGKILNYMTSDPTQISDIINDINTLAMDSWTPLAETFYTVTGYVQQIGNQNNEGPRYETDSYAAGTTTDPFYFQDLNKKIHCTQQNVILITDGESTQDKNVPSKFKTTASDVGGNDNATYDSDGSGYLDNIAYWAHTNDLRTDLNGTQSINLYTIFAFGSGSQLLQDAAKWGGFNDKDDDNLPDADEYDSNNDTVPDNYFEAASGADLENSLITAFSSILNRVSSGSAASVVSTSRKGEGLLYQAVFWPQRVDSNGKEISWAGDVYSYWLDDEGIMHEDNGATPLALDSSDSKVTIWYDDTQTLKRSRACSGGTVVGGECVNGTAKELTSVQHVWTAASWLNQVGLNATVQRSSYASAVGADKSRRFIMTWKDDNDGKVETGEVVPFTSANINYAYCNSTVVNWVRGLDMTGYRSRQLLVDTNYDGTGDTTVTWRLGDIINSSPTVVAAPAENYDLYWDDASYTDFYRKYRNRRIMVYFGANDGMLHAVNSGFYSQTDSAYYKHQYTNGTYDNSQGFDLGTEMWAYVPYNLHPHLPCLTDPKYQHQYYVDLKPRVFDAQVFATDVDHPNGWGTIMVTGFNFGGDGQQDLGRNSSYFGSSFFIFDITNPEKAPELLGEFTFDGNYTLGYALNQPTVVAVKDNSNVKHWYMLFGTGPLTAAGSSTQKAQVIVIPMKAMIDQVTNKAKSTFPLRLADDKTKPTMTSMGVLSLSDSNSAMGTGFVSVDYNFDFFVDMMYYGTVVTPNSGAMTGGVHRLKIEAEPDPSKWERKEMTNTGGPLTGAPNVGFKDKSVWVYFGSGKFWDVSDKTDLRTQWMYGIQEPKQTNSNAYNFSQIPAGNLLDVTKMIVKNDGLGTLECSDGSNCLPTDVTTVEELADYIRDSNSIDGWKRAMPNTGERVVGQPTLFGGLTNFTTFTPSNDYCTAEGSSKLYALYYLTGTAWKENVFGDGGGDYVPFIVDLGQGMGVSPSLHLGSEEGVRAFVQTSTGTIVEIHQPNLPIPNVKSGPGGWHTLELN